MPKLKQITCSVELGPSRTTLKEYGARYSDGVVECFIAVPDTQVPFCLHIESQGYIAPGLAVFVFMDGQYQCNRNRLHLPMPADGVPTTQCEVDFCMRQKEEKTSGGTFVGRDWSFTQLNTSNADNAASLNPNFMQNVGTIEVVILRCSSEGEQVRTPDLAFGKPGREVSRPSSDRHSRAPSVAPSSKAKDGSDAFGGMFGLFDGAGDEPEFSRPSKKIRKDRHATMVSDTAAVGGFDGTNDEPEPWKPVGKGGYLNEENRSVLTWDVCMGEMIPRYAADHSTAYYGRKERREREENHMAAENRDDRTEVHAAAAERNAQLDGHAEGQPQVVINNYGKDDMEGDKYFNAQGDVRRAQKDRLRDQGVAVSSTAPAVHREDVAQGYRHVPDLNEQYQFAQKGYQQAYEQPRHQFQPAANVDHLGHQAPAQPPKPIPILQVPAELEKLQAKIDESKREILSLNKLSMTAKQDAMPHILQEIGYLTLQEQKDVDLRDYLRRAYEQYVQMMNAAQPNIAGQQSAGQAQAYPQGYNNNTAPNNGWVQAGEGVVGGGASLNKDWQMPKKDENAGGNAGHGKQNSQGGDGANGWNNGQQNGNHWDDAKSHKSSHRKTPSNAGGWGDQGGQQNGGSNGWANGGSQKSGQKDNGWGAPAGSRTGSHAASNKDEGGWGGNGDNSGQADQGAGWGANNGAADSGNNAWNSGDGQQVEKRQANDWIGGGQQNQNSGANDQGWGTGGSRRATSAAASLAENFDTMSVSSNAQVKPYWADWRHSSAPHESSDPNTKRKREAARSVYDYPASPLPMVPAGKMRGASHGVQAGKGADYAHRCHRPNYMDTMKAPYAVFSFKYRSKTALEKILKRRIDADSEPIIQQAEKDKLMNMPKSKLIKELMRARMPQGASRSISAGNASAKAPTAAGWSAAPTSTKSAAGGWGGDNTNKSGNNNDNAWDAKKSSHGGRSQAGGNGGWDSKSRKSDTQAGGWANEKSSNTANAAPGWGAPDNNGGGDPWPKDAGGGWDGNNDAKSNAGGGKAKANAGGRFDATKSELEAANNWVPPEKYTFKFRDPDIPRMPMEAVSMATGFTKRSDRLGGGGEAMPVHAFGGFKGFKMDNSKWDPAYAGQGKVGGGGYATAAEAMAALSGTLGSGAGGQGMAMGGQGGLAAGQGGGVLAGDQNAMDPHAMYGGGGGGKAHGGAPAGAEDLLESNPMAKYAAGGAGGQGAAAW
ncbi:hypothetical protein LTR85_008455 [Meristemomyces frigidus]|nr:hypothetical protein LTR85_008455 [Meristemomyces frigidus]